MKTPTILLILCIFFARLRKSRSTTGIPAENTGGKENHQQQFTGDVCPANQPTGYPVQG